MEEEKAAAYYEELVRAGGAAARFKQGLGFSSDTQSTAKKDVYKCMPNFVKAGSGSQEGGAPGRENADQKQEARNGPSSDPSRAAEIVALKLGRKQAGETNRSPDKHSRRRSSRSSSPSERYRERQKDRNYTEKSRSRYSPDRGRRRERRKSVSRSPPPRKKAEDGRSSPNLTSDGSLSPERTFRKRRHSRRRSSSSARSSPDSRLSDRGGRGRRRAALSKKHRSRSSSVSSDEKRKYSGHRLREGRYRDLRKRSRSRSFSASSDEKRKYSRDKPRERDCKDSRGRSRSRSPYRKNRDEESKAKRRSSAIGAGREDRGQVVEANDRVDKSGHSNILNGGKKTSNDYSKLIPGFDSMTSAEKVKAKMKVQLSEAVAKGSVQKGAGETWERFHFNKEALLDDDTKLELAEDRTEAGDDTTFLQNTGSSFFSSTSQARREVQVQASHESAIFGTPLNDSTSDGKGSSIKDYQTTKNVTPVAPGSNIEKQGLASPSRNFISEQVLRMQQTSWRERALKSKEQRASSASGI